MPPDSDHVLASASGSGTSWAAETNHFLTRGMVVLLSWIPLAKVVNSLSHKGSVLSKVSEETQAGICGIMTGILIWVCLVDMTMKGGAKPGRKEHVV
jgi:hypothetical protein